MKISEEKMYNYIETYATVKHLQQTLRVLPYAKELHKGQFRLGRDKIPYFCHPLMVACHALALGLDEDDLISTAILHDVCEDCGAAVNDLPVNAATKEAVSLLTKTDAYYNGGEEEKAKYFQGIAKNRIAVMVKLLDRCNNVSEMADAFSKKKMASYIKDTEKWIYPLIEKARADYPMYSNQVFLIKYHMASSVETVKNML